MLSTYPKAINLACKWLLVENTFYCMFFFIIIIKNHLNFTSGDASEAEFFLKSQRVTTSCCLSSGWNIAAQINPSAGEIVKTF